MRDNNLPWLLRVGYHSTLCTKEGKGYCYSEAEKSLWKDCLEELKSLVKELGCILAAPQGGSKINDESHLLLLIQSIAELPSG